MSEFQSHIETPEQSNKLERLESDGLILDLGGGGEGLVSRIEGDRVCVVDIRMSEIITTIEHKKLENTEMYNVFLRPHFTAGVLSPIFLSSG